jgi:3-hydroxyacyl-CoA dehydrogenase/enoyl-CoA hydratase/3-hydroxybutyryl-CoA epimerase/enoyl-CoA isomerase
VDFREIDRVMEAFGWPMGPAWLLDVVGIDTAEHAQNVMAEGFPQRMRYDFKTVIELLHENGQYGQKSGSGFYRYETDSKGRKQKVFDKSILAQLKPIQKAGASVSEEEIVERMMLALCLEAVRCLEDAIVATPIEADMGLILGLGFPRFRGGALRYIDSMGARAFCEMAERHAALGPLYQPTRKLRQMAAAGQTFYR